MSGNTSSHGKDSAGNWKPIGSGPFIIWAGAGTTNAPTLEYNTIGFNNSAASTANVYTYDSPTDAWVDKTQTVSGFFGVAV